MRSSRAIPITPISPAIATTQFGTIKAADGTTLYWEMITPAAGAGQEIPGVLRALRRPRHRPAGDARLGQGALPQYLVDRGWIFFQIDNRGSANRGKAFEDAIYHAMGTVEVADQLAGANYLKTLPFVDPARDRDLWLVLRRLHDAQDAGGDPGRLCRGGRRARR